MIQDNSSKYRELSKSEAMEKIKKIVNHVFDLGLLESVEFSVRKHRVTEITIGQNSETYLIPFANELNASEIAKTLESELVNYTPHNLEPRFFAIKYTKKISSPKGNLGFIRSIFKGALQRF
ncbi:hypothetical protein [Methylophaga sp.]|uniref:hypothetical protein n=1 Tax=Methylophaga sp. TaxID=2024840 RepID=UPI003A8D901D